MHYSHNSVYIEDNKVFLSMWTITQSCRIRMFPHKAICFLNFLTQNALKYLNTVNSSLFTLLTKWLSKLTYLPCCIPQRQCPMKTDQTLRDFDVHCGFPDLSTWHSGWVHCVHTLRKCNNAYKRCRDETRLIIELIMACYEDGY